MECPSCEAGIPADSNFCPFCGLPIILRRNEDDARAMSLPADEFDAEADTSELVVTEQGDRSVSRSPTAAIPGAGRLPDGRDAQTAQLAVCSRCGARNGPLRSACGRCGKPLAGHDDPTAAQRPVRVDSDQDTFAAAPPAAKRQADRRRRESRADDALDRRVSPGRMVFLVGAVIGTALGLVGWFVFGAGAGRDPASAPTFDSGVYVTQPRDLDVASVTATSSRPPGDDGPHGPELVVDDDAATAWIEGAEAGSGRGEGLTLRFTDAVWVKNVSVHNGYQRDEDTYDEKARARRLRATFDDGTQYVIALDDVDGAQRAAFPDPVLTRAVELEVLDVYGGDVSDELAISELRVDGWRARGADRRAPHVTGRR